MDRRTLLALLLTAIVIVLTPKIFSTPARQLPVQDTLAVSATDSVRSAAPTTPAAPAPTVGPARASTAPTVAPAIVRAETTTVRTQHALYSIVSPGGTPVNVTLPD